MPELTDVNKPYTSNYPPLDKWLRDRDARCDFQLIPKGPRPLFYLEQWHIGAATFLVKIYRDRAGWEIYTPGNSNCITSTLADAEARLGLSALAAE